MVAKLVEFIAQRFFVDRIYDAELRRGRPVLCCYGDVMADILQPKYVVCHPSTHKADTKRAPSLAFVREALQPADSAHRLGPAEWCECRHEGAHYDGREMFTGNAQVAFSPLLANHRHKGLMIRVMSMRIKLQCRPAELNVQPVQACYGAHAAFQDGLSGALVYGLSVVELAVRSLQRPHSATAHPRDS